MLQDERQSLLSRRSDPHPPHPFLIQRAEGREKQTEGGQEGDGWHRWVERALWREVEAEKRDRIGINEKNGQS